MNFDSRGDRHLLPFTVEHRAGFLAGRILVRAGGAAVLTRSGQTILWMLTNLLSRQYGVVHELIFDIPATVTLDGIALFGSEQKLAQTLSTTARLINDLIAVSEFDGSDREYDVLMSIGAAQTGKPIRTQFSLCAWGHGWKAFIGGENSAPLIDQNDPFADNSLGPILAACLAAGEVFRILTDWRGERNGTLEPKAISLWSGTFGRRWDDVPDGRWTNGVKLPAFYLCGAGAVGQSLVAALCLCKRLSGHAVVIDSDVLDGSNHNRYPLAHLKVGQVRKVDLATSTMRTCGFTADALHCTWEQFVVGSKDQITDPLLVADAKHYRFPLVVSCVDTNEARHAIQNCWPRLILGGSTLDLRALLTRSDPVSDRECLKCGNRLRVRPTVEEEFVRWRSLSPSDLDSQLCELSEDQRAAVVDYLARGKCGMAGQQIIDELGRRSQREFAVGFVSLGAGVMLAAALVQLALDDQAVFLDGDAVSLNFLNIKIWSTDYPRQPDCDCLEARETIFRKLWPASGP